MKRTKQVETMVKVTNENLKTRKVISENDELFMWFNWLLMKADCYNGFNWYYEKTLNNETIQVLAGTSNPLRLKELNAYIQFN